MMTTINTTPAIPTAARIPVLRLSGRLRSSRVVRGRSVRSAASGDGPDRFDAVAAQGVDAVVEVEGGIAMRGEELDALAEGRAARGIVADQSPVLVARELIGQPRPLHRFRR